MEVAGLELQQLGAAAAAVLGEGVVAAEGMVGAGGVGGAHTSLRVVLRTHGQRAGVGEVGMVEGGAAGLRHRDWMKALQAGRA